MKIWVDNIHLVYWALALGLSSLTGCGLFWRGELGMGIAGTLALVRLVKAAVVAANPRMTGPNPGAASFWLPQGCVALLAQQCRVCLLGCEFRRRTRAVVWRDAPNGERHDMTIVLDRLPDWDGRVATAARNLAARQRDGAGQARLFAGLDLCNQGLLFLPRSGSPLLLLLARVGRCRRADHSAVRAEPDATQLSSGATL